MNALGITYLTLEFVMGMISVVGNAMVLIAIYRNASLRTATNCFIGSLALADLLVGIVVAPCAALSYVGLPRNFLGCVFVNCLVIVFTQVSIFSLFAIAVERFIAIKYPFAYNRYVTIIRSIIMLIVTWILAFIVGLVPMFGWNKGPPKDMTCYFTNVIGYDYMVYFNFIGCILTPLVIMFAIYIYIFSIVHQQIIAIEALKIKNGVKKKKTFLREIKAAKSLVMVLVLFAICWLPIHICNCITLFCDECNLPMQLMITVILLSHANSVFNPLLYAYGNSKFKRAFRKMLCCSVLNEDMDSSEFVTYRSQHMTHSKAERQKTEPETETTYDQDLTRPVPNGETEFNEFESNSQLNLTERDKVHMVEIVNEITHSPGFIDRVSNGETEFNKSEHKSQNIIQNANESEMENTDDSASEITYTQDPIHPVSNVETEITDFMHESQQNRHNKTDRDNLTDFCSEIKTIKELVSEHLTTDAVNSGTVLESLPTNVLFICHL